MNPARLIIDKHCGSMNMAVDEALLLSAPQSGPTLRFYQWEKPTLSLGYFQNATDRLQHEASRGCPIVRRTTGGGAILHDRELTYSFVLPLSHQDKSAAQPLYHAFHESLVEALATFGVSASLSSQQPLHQINVAEPFLCFQRRTNGDVLLSGAKIGGSAQRRHKLALLQHGSVLLDKSPYAPELPGIKDLAGQHLTAKKLVEIWLALLKKQLDLDFTPASLSDFERNAANRLAEDRFGSDSWSSRR